MTKLNYETRFAHSGASARYGYDEKVDKAMRDGIMRMVGKYRALPQYKKEILGAKISAKNKAKREKRNGIEKDMRDAAERRMVEALHKCIETLEFHMEDMIQYRAFSNTRRHVNQIAIHNVIWLLRQKCGLMHAFSEDTEYDHPVHHDPQRSEEQKRDDVRVEMEQQRQARIRHNREIAERLKARPKTRAADG